MNPDRLLIPGFYLAWVLLALILAWRSRRTDLIEVGGVLLAAWVAHNVIVETQGAHHAPLLIPTVDAIMALACAYVAIFERSRSAALVLFLFVMVGLVHVAAFETHTQGTYFYFLVLNLLFFAQVVLIGGTGGRSVWNAVADRAHRGDLRPGARSLSR